MMGKNILITGVPGIGKTTLIKKLVESFKSYHLAGFYTGEIRDGRIRKGFTLTSLYGQESILSHVDIKSPCRLGKYGVDVTGFDRFLDTLDLLKPLNKILIIDEIGKMECFSEKFKMLVKRALDSGQVVLATIALRAGGFIDEIKKRKDVELYEITRINRDLIAEKIIDTVRGYLDY